MADKKPQSLEARESDMDLLLSSSEGEAPPLGPRKGVSPKRVLVILVSVVAALVLIVAGVLGFYVARANRAISDIGREDYMPAPLPGPSSASTAPTKGLNYVLLGTDSNATDVGRSDSLMIAHVPQDRSKVYLISFPRDMWVDIPGHGKGKINWAYAFGGPKLTVQTLNQLTGIQMDHTASVDFQGFIGLTEALGGVTVENPNAFTATHGGYRFEKGPVTLRGDQALGFVRERYNLPNGDLDRAANQRLVVKAILAKAAAPETVANPVAVDRLLGDASKIVKVDQGLTDQEIRDTITSMKVRSAADIVSLQAPIYGFSTAGDQAIDEVDYNQLKELSNAMRNDTIDDYLQRFPKSCTGPHC